MPTIRRLLSHAHARSGSASCSRARLPVARPVPPGIAGGQAVDDGASSTDTKSREKVTSHGADRNGRRDLAGAAGPAGLLARLLPPRPPPAARRPPPGGAP